MSAPPTPTQRLRRLASATLEKVTGPVPVSIVLAFVIGAGFIAIAGADPAIGYASMIDGSVGSGLGIANTLQRAIPLVGMALAVAVAFRAGVINLGAEGQLVLGGLAAGVVAFSMPGPAPLVMVTACLAAIATGALWGVLAAGLRAWPGVPILITTLLLNYPARYFASWTVRFPLRDQESSMVATRAIDPAVQLPMLAPSGSSLGQAITQTFGADHALALVGRSVNWGLVLVALLVVAVAFMNRRTTFGFESGINGLNPTFARYSGVRTGMMTMQTMLISGGIAGFIGALLTIGAPNARIIDGALVGTNYAWTGLLVALLALYRPLRVVLAGLFFAAITAGSGAMGRELAMSPQIAAVIQGIVIVLLAFRVRLPSRRRRRGDPEEVEPSEPKAASEPADELGRV